MRFAVLPLILSAALFWASCSESVDTRLRIDQPYSIYGIINPEADTHGVRVFEIQTHIQLVSPDPIDASVTTTLLRTGETLSWQDSVIQLDDGDYRHVFWAAFRPEPYETYHLDVVRSDGATSSAITTIPGPVTLELLEPDTTIRNEAIMPILVRGSPPALPRVDVEYIVAGFPEGGGDPIFKPTTFAYWDSVVEDENGKIIEVDLIRDFIAIFREFERDDAVTTDVIELRDIHLRVHVADGNWISPIGVFDPEFLVEPGAFSNVENGFGFFGSVFVDSLTFRPPLVLLQRAGFAE